MIDVLRQVARRLLNPAGNNQVDKLIASGDPEGARELMLGIISHSLDDEELTDAEVAHLEQCQTELEAAG